MLNFDVNHKKFQSTCIILWLTLVVNESSSRRGSWIYRGLSVGVGCVGHSSFWGMSMSAGCSAKLVIIVLGEMFWREKAEDMRKLRGYYTRNMERKGSKTETKATHFHRQMHVVWCHRCGRDSILHTLDPIFLRNSREQPELHHSDAIHA